MSRRVLGINGLRTREASATQCLLERLRHYGFDCVDADYPMPRWFVRPGRVLGQFEGAAVIVKDAYRDDDVVIAHGRGCLVSLRMMEMSCRFSDVFWFRPVVPHCVEIPSNGCDRLWCIYGLDDRALWLTSLPGILFGNTASAGLTGLAAGDFTQEGYDRRVVNLCAPEYERHDAWHHGDDFLEGNIDGWVDVVLNRVNGG